MTSRVKLIVGVLLIGAILVGLWVAYRPLFPSETIVDPEPTPAPPQLQDSRAVVTVRRPGTNVARRAVITCDGERRAARGYWSTDPRGACDALAATRGALLGPPGCSGTGAATLRLHVTGRFGSRRVDHRAQRGGCPDDDGWLAVNVLVAPVASPGTEQALEPAASGG